MGRQGVERLTAKAVAAAVSRAAKTGSRLELSDGGGLVLRCAPTGVATWTYAYRSRAAGGMRRVTLGLYGDTAPALSLAAARHARGVEAARNKSGDDPKNVHKRERIEQSQAAMTFGDLCDKYVEDVKAKGKLSWKTDEGYLKRPKTKFGKRALLSVTKRELLDFLEGLARTSKSSANRTQSVIRTMWGWAAERDYIPMNFLAGIKKVGGKEVEKDRVLTDEELKMLFAILDDEASSTGQTIRLALKVILLTAQRPGEVAGMMLSELHDLDGTNPHWIIPAKRTKNKKAEHTVPLSATVVALIHKALEASKGDGSEAEDDETRSNDVAVFAGRYKSKNTLARHSMSQAVRRIVEGPKDETEVRVEKPIAAFTPHDLRRTAATIVQAARLPVDFVKALLNHNDKGVTGVYARWHMFQEKREAVTAIEKTLKMVSKDSHRENN